MAIVQISRVTHRKGLQENLPQLAGAEFGWSLDARRLFIGNGTLEEGAPTIGNTEILTEHSDVLALASKYTYRGLDAGYTVQTNTLLGDDVLRTLQSKFDETVSVRDFGAVGDGVANDGPAINRALRELYCREVQTPQIRRQLLFPAGVYMTTETILLPPYASITGEGLEASRIEYRGPAGQPAVRTCDTLRQVGINIGVNGAQPPRAISIAAMEIASTVPGTVVFALDRAQNVTLTAASFRGPFTQSTLVNSDGSCGIELRSAGTFEVAHVTVSHCRFTSTTYGIRANAAARGVTIENCDFTELYFGVRLGETVGSAPVGTRVIQSTFDRIAAEGIYSGQAANTVSAFNMFYNVGANFDEATVLPAYSVVSLLSGGVSYGDFFARLPAHTKFVPVVDIGSSTGWAFEGNERVRMGAYSRTTGLRVTVPAGAAEFSAIAIPVPTNLMGTFEVEYSIRKISDPGLRTGTVRITNGPTVAWDDEYSESADMGVTFTVGKSEVELQESPTIFQDVITILCTLTSDAAKQRILSYTVKSIS